MNKNKLLLIVFFLGLALRLWLSVLNRSGDLNNHLVWTNDFISFGSVEFYEREFSARRQVIAPNYPPLAIYFFLISEWLYDFSSKCIWFLNINLPIFPSGLVALWKERYIQEVFYKLPAMVSDIGIALIVYLFIQKIKKHSSLTPLIGACFIVFNPAFFYNSAYWGQIDSIPIFFLLLSLYLFMYTRMNILPAALFCCALLSKQTVAVFVPIWILLWLKNRTVKQCVTAFLTGLLLFIVSFFAFSHTNNPFLYPFVTYWNKILTASGSLHVTNHAFNLWYLLPNADKTLDTDLFVLGLSYRQWGWMITGALIIPTLYFFYKRTFNQITLLYVTTLVPFAVFLTLTRIHERHFLQVLPFVLLLSALTGRYFKTFIYLSLFHFMNLYHGWWSPEIPIIKYIFTQNVWINLLVIITLILFINLYRDYLNHNSKIIKRNV